MSERRVVITGIGVWSHWYKFRYFWNSLIEGKSGIDRIASLDPSDFIVK